jgi:hypothetical protein
MAIFANSAAQTLNLTADNSCGTIRMDKDARCYSGFRDRTAVATRSTQRNTKALGECFLRFSRCNFRFLIFVPVDLFSSPLTHSMMIPDYRFTGEIAMFHQSCRNVGIENSFFNEFRR